MLECFVMRLLIFPLVITGINVDGDSLELTFPCTNSVCYHIWRFTQKSERIHVVLTSNGEMMQSARVESQEGKCTRKLERLTEDNIGLHYCKITDDAFTPQSEPPVFKVAPGFDVSFHCTLLSFLTRTRCSKTRKFDVRLRWVDRTGQEISDNMHYRISQKSRCDVTLTVTLQTPGSEEFRCQAIVGEKSWTSAEMRVQVPVPKGRGKGRGDFNVKEVNPQGMELSPLSFENALKMPNMPQKSFVSIFPIDSHYKVGVVVAVLACAMLTALAAMFVVFRRRKAANLHDASCPAGIHDHVADDVIYADVVLPVGPDRVSFSQGQDTEYACIHYH
ncbi:uncharacterized protein LOC127592295 isoform X1 [Hippocampus zosterae]|uniref:uncharacterized protein LOC127592295 isoform X1 n=1 Tax=Hippocampus zosterae TaxID=109293 RepID=UPI00223D9A10|nr:uncharacterized protein LOC127592295 isoform X1 [Hippocampus zosterae]